MTVLVTGASGFVGAAVVRRLVSHGYRVRALVRPGSDLGNLEGVDCEIAEGDLLDRASLAAALAPCWGLFHVAADYRLWVPDRQRMFEINVDGTRALMLAALDAGVQRIVHTSSVATLGTVSDGVADERTPVRFADMIGPYKQSKFLAEQEVRRLVEERDLPAVIVNPSTPIGPGDRRPTPTGRIIAEAVAGRMPAYVDTGLNIVHVDDVAEGHVLAFERGVTGERYILGGENMLLADILREIARLVGRRPPLLRLPHAAVVPVAVAVEAWSRVFGGEPFITIDALRMAGKRMFFSSDKAATALHYRARPAARALREAVEDVRRRGGKVT